MANARPTFSTSQNTALVVQVGRICPLCATPLFYKKNGKSQKKYELAHIYPLNPKPDELILLKNEERLSTDVNHDHNLIPLCVTCHTKFDKPRTIADYRELVKIKKNLIKKDEQQSLWEQYPIEADIRRVIDALYSDDPIPDVDLSLDPKKLDTKLNGAITNVTKRKIKNNVATYYKYVKDKLADVDAGNPGAANLIATEVKLFYFKQKTLCTSQQEIFTNVVEWISIKTNPQTSDAAEIVASFFIQNCEVFE